MASRRFLRFVKRLKSETGSKRKNKLCLLRIRSMACAAKSTVPQRLLKATFVDDVDLGGPEEFMPRCMKLALALGKVELKVLDAPSPREWRDTRKITAD